MILLEPANKITHCNVEIKRRTISLTGFSAIYEKLRLHLSVSRLN